MAIDKEFLTGIIGNNENAEEIMQIIIDAHMETVNGIKAQIEEYKPHAAMFIAASEQLEAARNESNQNDHFRTEYERLRAENDSMREKAKKEAAFEVNAAVFRDCLNRAGVPAKRHGTIIKASKDYIASLEAADGKVRNLDAVLSHINSEWGDLIP